MEKIFKFIRAIWAWFMGLFKNKSKTPEQTTADNSIKWTNPIVPKHNNRGKNVQYIPLGNGRFRAIYHNG